MSRGSSADEPSCRMEPHGPGSYQSGTSMQDDRWIDEAIKMASEQRCAFTPGRPRAHRSSPTALVIESDGAPVQGGTPVHAVHDDTLRLLVTGGSGRLGRELQAHLPALIAPTRRDLDVTDPSSVQRAMARHRPDIVVHAAAFTDVAAAERDPTTCWRVNVIGTRHMVNACTAAGSLLVHISLLRVLGRHGPRSERTRRISRGRSNRSRPQPLRP